MLTLILPPEITTLIEQALRRSGQLEVGGVLMAKHVGENEFVVNDISVHRRGAFASFLRRIEEAWEALNRFFKKTNYDYNRYNYIGEWHSHPSFALSPSQKDHSSMFEIISDDTVGANFVVLMIVKLNTEKKLIGSLHTYLPNGVAQRSTLIVQR